MQNTTQRNDVRIVGSAHSGRRGDFRARLFLAKRRYSAPQNTLWEVATIPADGPTVAVRFMGLAIVPGGLMAVAGSKDRAFLATFNQNLKQTGWHELSGARDPHGLVVEDNQLWVVSSGTNEVIRYEMSASGPSAAQTVFRHPDTELQHFNGLARHGGMLVLSAFGRSAEAVRRTSFTGYLIDIACGALIRVGLDQPHSPYSFEGSLLFCESQTSFLWHGDRHPVRLGGYLRGVVVTADSVVHVAASAPRPPRDLLTDDRDDAAIWSLTPDGNVLACDKLKGVGPEVYDLVTLPHGWLSPKFALTKTTNHC